jgi:hypothetical protein
MFPETTKILPVLNTMTSLAKIIQVSPHSEVLPYEPTSLFLLQRLRLNDTSKVIIKDPRLRLLTEPLRLVKLTGPMSIFSQDDSMFETLLTSVNTDLLSVTKVAFAGSYAEEALWNIFNLTAGLSHKDRLEIKSFKVVNLLITINNQDLTDYKKLIMNPSFLARGI